MPDAARMFMTEGVRRLAAYQDLAYARLYLDRLEPIRDADAKSGADGRLLAATARHLAVRMSYEDVIRVAQAKIDPARFERVAREVGVKPEQTFTITEFLKPGIDEFCSILPPWLARPLLGLAERHPAFGRLHWGMAVNTASVSGYLRFFMLAKLRGFRRKTHRFHEEQREIEAWLDLIARAAPLSAELAIEIARMRPPHQRLWRHPQARQRQLPPDRGASDRTCLGRWHGPGRRPSTPSPARAPRRFSIPMAKRWQNASPTLHRSRRMPWQPNRRPALREQSPMLFVVSWRVG